MGKSLATLGLYERPWEDLQFPRLRGVGNLESTRFQAYEWKPNYPCPPFENATARDNFWAAKLIVRFDDALLRAAVDAAEYSDPAAADYMVRTLPSDATDLRAIASRASSARRFRESFRRPRCCRGRARGKVLPPARAPGTAPRACASPTSRCAGFVAPRSTLLVRGPHTAPVAIGHESSNSARGLVAGSAPAADDVESRLLRLTIARLAPTWSPPVDVTVYLHPSGELRVAAIERDE